MRTRLAGTLLFIAALPGAVWASKPAPQSQGVESRIRAVLNAQVAAWNRGDILGFMQGYWNSPRTEFESSSGVLHGWKQVLERYRKMYPGHRSMGTLGFSNLEVTVLGPKAALALGHWSLHDPSGARGGVFTLVFRKFPDGWHIINDHTSVVSPGLKP